MPAKPRRKSGGRQSDNDDNIDRKKSAARVAHYIKATMGSPLNWNVRAVLALSMTVGGLCLFLLASYGHGAPEGIINAIATGTGLATNWKSLDFLSEEFPKEVEDFLREKGIDYRVDERTVKIKDFSVFYRECHPASVMTESGKTVLLLHGQAFTSETWQQSNVLTMQTLAALGHRVLAVDLPGGLGKTSKSASAMDPSAFLEAVIAALSPAAPPVVVSPSMSGKFSLPLLIGRPETMCGFVPVAPVNTARVAAHKYASVSVPTLIVYGEKDSALGRASAKDLQQIPTASKPQIIPNARHPCYLDNPKMFNTLLNNFIRRLSC